jgi:hypothetical protein
LDAATLCRADSLLGASDDGRCCQMLELDDILDVELRLGVVVDPASWHGWYLELVTWTSSLKHGCWASKVSGSLTHAQGGRCKVQGGRWKVEGARCNKVEGGSYLGCRRC